MKRSLYFSKNPQFKSSFVSQPFHFQPTTIISLYILSFLFNIIFFKLKHLCNIHATLMQQICYSFVV